MQSVDADSARSVLMLLAAVITAVGAILNFAQARAKDATTAKGRREAYRDVMGWIETALWAAGIPASMFGGDLALCFWAVAYLLGCGLFLTGQDPKRLRLDIFRLVFSSLALALFWSMAAESRMLSLFSRLLDTLQPG